MTSSGGEVMIWAPGAPVPTVRVAVANVVTERTVNQSADVRSVLSRLFHAGNGIWPPTTVDVNTSVMPDQDGPLLVGRVGHDGE